MKPEDGTGRNSPGPADFARRASGANAMTAGQVDEGIVEDNSSHYNNRHLPPLHHQHKTPSVAS